MTEPHPVRSRSDDGNRDARAGSRVVVVGGYGHVGARLAALLRERHPVVIAGRRPDAASRVAADLGVIAAPVSVDTVTAHGLDAVAHPGDLVVSASGDHPDAALLRRAIDLGCHYTDLTADPITIAAMLDLDAAARSAGVSALIGVGLAPGATNVLALAAVEGLPGADHVDVGVRLSVMDGFGPAAVDWTLASLGSSVSIDHDGRTTTVVPFRARTRLQFGPGRPSPVYEFAFPEQFFLPETLGVPSASGWFTLRPPFAAHILGAFARSERVRTTLARPGVRRKATGFVAHLPEPRHGRAVAATAVTRRDEETVSVTLRARSESDTTARCARALLDLWDHSVAGVHLPESVIPPEPFLDAIAADGIEVSTTRTRNPGDDRRA